MLINTKIIRRPLVSVNSEHCSKDRIFWFENIHNFLKFSSWGTHIEGEIIIP